MQLGLFLLEGVLLPTEQTPLHVFEARYKELIGECLERELEFGWVLSDEEGGIRDVGCRATVLGVLEELDDGRLLIAVEGGNPFRIERLTSGRSFATAQIADVEDDGTLGQEEEIERALSLFGQIVELSDLEAEVPDPGSPVLSYELAARVDFERGAKQELLESRSERERLAAVTKLLDVTAVLLAREKEASDRAPTNGKVSPR
jgi:Lon protease-like protein